ncbi:hypothetical protein CEA92_14390 [Bacillus velezensis]|nr:hypothetical protein CEA92_14390 [Bacillus velezensis]
MNWLLKGGLAHSLMKGGDAHVNIPSINANVCFWVIYNCPVDLYKKEIDPTLELLRKVKG